MKIKLDIRPLSANQLWIFHGGRRHKSKKYRQYERDVALLLPRPIKQIEGLVSISYKFFLKYWQITDGDNLVKALQDILVAHECIEDDRKVMKYIIEKIPAKENHIEIEIEAWRE